jgi:hypothetical protein
MVLNIVLWKMQVGYLLRSCVAHRHHIVYENLDYYAMLHCAIELATKIVVIFHKNHLQIISCQTCLHKIVTSQAGPRTLAMFLSI